MYQPLPFVKRFMRLSPRQQGYSTALSTKYWDWGGLRDNHGQHTVLLLVYSWTFKGRSLKDFLPRTPIKIQQ